MEHTITTSADGSSTLKLNEFNECYHSSNGAYNEAMHIYIKSGIEALYSKIICNNSLENVNNEMQITIYDVGLGTALNCILTLLWQQSLCNLPHIKYVGIEKYPIAFEEAAKLNYPSYIADCVCNNEVKEKKSEEIRALFNKIHNTPWEQDIEIAPNFILHKSCADIVTFKPKASIKNCINNSAINCKSVIFYDTFSPTTQPHLWSKEIFKCLYDSIESQSILVTYCSKGTVKQALRDAGFIVKRLAGPEGKRHIVQAIKP